MALPPSQPPTLRAAAGLADQPTSLVGGFAEDRGPGRFVLCTDREVHVQRRDEDELALRLLTPPSPQVRPFFMVFYSDPHFSRVTAVQLVEVMGMRSEVVRVAVGQSVDRTICLPPAEVKEVTAVSVFSSHPEAVTVQQTEVDPKFGAKITITVTALQVGKSTCRVHAVDSSTRRRLAAMLLVIAADLPEVKFVHDISLPVLTATRKNLQYKNESARPMRYRVRSSDPAIVTVQTPELVMSPLGERMIDLLFHAVPATLSYTSEVFLFITSEDRAIQETRVLQLTYT